jgi:hypothetical protein
VHALNERDRIHRPEEVLHADLSDGDHGERVPEHERDARKHEAVADDLAGAGRVRPPGRGSCHPDAGTNENHENREDELSHL